MKKPVNPRKFVASTAIGAVVRRTLTHEFALKPDGSQTVVTWTAKGNSPFIFKLMLVFVSADSMMGDKFEEGLANLKAVAAG